jgi:hypothetical protein
VTTLNVDRAIAVWSAEMRDVRDGPNGLIDGNWMAILVPDEKGHFTLQFRYRWYVDDNVHDSQDVRSFYQSNFPPTVSEQEAIVHARRYWETVCEHANVKERWELLRGARDLEDFLDVLAQMPGISMKKVPL